MKKLKMKNETTQGSLITFCGLDGCGKTTMMNRLKQDLGEKYELLITKQPTNVVRKSELFRNYMDSPNHDEFEYRTLSLVAAGDRIQHVEKVIRPALQKGSVVLSDRYFYSCLANLRSRGYYDDKWIYEIARNIIRPDIAFFFDVPVEVAVERVRMRPEEKDRYIDMDLQYRLRKEYVNICRKNRGVLIDTTLSEDECYFRVKKEVERVLKNGCV